MIELIKFLYYSAGTMLLIASAILGSFAIGIGFGILIKLGDIAVTFTLQ
jgi:hypothetical protein